ncbi:CoA pyrophosphatase [Microlunatus sp. Gsoil 973]|uniref:NUDIX hydrolase n=1 Tax=Microlunatus sp. Gsoil 973 TaxID=2672569 RepID=UPI001E2B2A7D|nr:CoA pyrophosphatase [Microlunatus sp. Gsoil 973]
MTDHELPTWLRPLQHSLSEAERTFAAEPAAGRPAGVLVLFGEDRRGPDLLFIERAASLRSHPGQVAFPGGGLEDGDADLVAAALREAAEETGLDPSGVEVFGEMSPLDLEVSGFQVTPVLGWWRQTTPVAVVDPGEVAAVRRVPIADLTTPGNRYTMVHPSGRRGPGFPGRRPVDLGIHRLCVERRPDSGRLAAAVEPGPDDGGTVTLSWPATRRRPRPGRTDRS